MAQAWPHRSFWAEKSLYIERVVPLLITGGVFIHLVRIGAYLRDREARVSDVLQPVVDAPLTLLMIYCAIGLLFWRSCFRRFQITSMRTYGASAPENGLYALSLSGSNS